MWTTGLRLETLRRKKWLLNTVVIAIATTTTVMGFVAMAYAETIQSPNYRFDESLVGGGGLVQSNSANFQSLQSLSDTGVGNSASSNYQVEASSNTTPDPTLIFAINNADVNFGTFTPSAATVTSSTFSVTNYTSYGYAVQIVGNAPSNGAHTITAMASTGPSQAGIEQFGINLVANTSPSSVGANPDHGLFGFGDAATNYDTPNNYRYVSGETIATAPKSSGQTTYTISYMVNVAPLTPGGQYKGDQQIICTGTY